MSPFLLRSELVLLALIGFHLLSAGRPARPGNLGSAAISHAFYEW